MDGICRICGKLKSGQDFKDWVKDTFTNHDLLLPGTIICDDCLFWFDDNSTELQKLMGKDKPQRMRNYSHFVKSGTWYPFSKANKAGMAEIITQFPFPEVAIIADSGQKHIAFRARKNPAGQSSGWLQFEEQSVWIDQKELIETLAVVNDLYRIFSKTEIETGKYFSENIKKFGINAWRIQDEKIRSMRKSLPFAVCMFLAQREDKKSDGKQESGNDSDTFAIDLGRSSSGLQEQISEDDLGTIRKRDQVSGIHQQPIKIHQLDLFTAER